MQIPALHHHLYTTLQPWSQAAKHTATSIHTFETSMSSATVIPSCMNDGGRRTRSTVWTWTTRSTKVLRNTQPSTACYDKRFYVAMVHYHQIEKLSFSMAQKTVIILGFGKEQTHGLAQRETILAYT
jgi:hypothetical protein